MNNGYEKYKDIINLPHHVSKKHPQMSLESRTAQFAPFAALTGYDDEVRETARITNERIEIDDEAKNIIDNKIQMILDQLLERPTVKIAYFVPDGKKKGGRYYYLCHKNACYTVHGRGIQTKDSHAGNHTEKV